MGSKISVVIPAYNVSEYIGKCLDTVLAQTYENLEVVVVNDGSADRTPEIIRNYTGDSRMKYIDQKNAGVAAARNAGMEAATGEYLAFVDSDDYLEPEMYERLYSAITENNADVAACDYNLIYEDRIEKSYSSMRDRFIDAAADITDYFFKYCACPKPNNYIWTRLYRTEIIKKSGIRFQNHKLSDDTLFNFMLSPYISRVVNLSGGYYNYLQRKNSNVYTAAQKSNLAGVYASVFSILAEYYAANGFKAEFLPIHAYTTVRSIFFYSRLAGMTDGKIAESIETGFQNNVIKGYLREQSLVGRYAAVNGFPAGHADRMKWVMQAAAENPHELIGAMIE
jgi:glycosyltransferase involved in cell wall biosynthesis